MGQMDGRSALRLLSTRSTIIAISVISGLIALLFLANEVFERQASLRKAPSDNLQWSLSQVQIELLRFQTSVLQAKQAPDSDLAPVRNRFDILYSRVNILETGDVFAVLRADAKSGENLADIRTILDAAAAPIDASDVTLRNSFPRLEQQIDQLKPIVQAVLLTGVSVYAEAADANRNSFATLLLRTGMVALALIFALFAVLLILVRQTRQLDRHSQDMEESRERYASMVNASLDAIVVSDAEGNIIDFNPAAEQTFGYSKNAAIGARMDELIIPEKFRAAHRKGMQRYLNSGVSKVISAGRIELEALHADGSEFPVELSLGQAVDTDSPIFIGYLRDISERVQTQKELTQARDMALAAAKAKSEFLAVMSHEMRTPLNGVLGILDLLGSTQLNAQQQHYVQTAVTSGEILQHHINDVLDIARIESGHLDIKPKRFDLESLLTEVISVNEPMAELRSNKLELSIDPALVDIVHDRSRLRQVLVNLVGNAAKFTHDGRIHLSAKPANEAEHEGSIEIAVADTGIGISKEDAARIFDDFVMLDPSNQRVAQGTGLGLAISRRIVEAMGGQIGLDSVPGEGSTFWIRIPEQAENFDAHAAPQEWSASNKLDRTERRTAVPIEPLALNILLVEDNKTNRLVAREMLTALGCTVVEAKDGAKGVAKSEATRFDLIFMDISMPKMDGITATRAIRGGDGLSKAAPIVGLTANAFPEDVAAFKAAGMQNCLIKPLRKADLDQFIASGAFLEGSWEASDIAAESDANAILDGSMIDEMAEILPSEKLRQRLDRFHSELTELSAMTTAHEADMSSDELAALAHKHAGSAAVFGAAALRSALLELETACKSSDTASYDDKMERVVDQANRTLPLIDEIRQAV